MPIKLKVLWLILISFYRIVIDVITHKSPWVMLYIRVTSAPTPKIQEITEYCIKRGVVGWSAEKKKRLIDNY